MGLLAAASAGDETKKGRHRVFAVVATAKKAGARRERLPCRFLWSPLTLKAVARAVTRVDLVQNTAASEQYECIAFVVTVSVGSKEDLFVEHDTCINLERFQHGVVPVAKVVEVPLSLHVPSFHGPV